MEQLLNAAKELLSHRVKYFEAHPEMLDIVNDLGDSEYDQAWEALQAAVDANEMAFPCKTNIVQ